MKKKIIEILVNNEFWDSTEHGYNSTGLIFRSGFDSLVNKIVSVKNITKGEIIKIINNYVDKDHHLSSSDCIVNTDFEDIANDIINFARYGESNIYSDELRDKIDKTLSLNKRDENKNK